MHTGRPPYLSDLLHYHEPMRSLRSSSSHQLSVPRHNLSFGSRAFRFSAPRVWNSLPVSIRESHSLPTFRSNLKTFTFQLPTLPRISLSTRPDSSKTLALYKLFTYLLTYLLFLRAIAGQINLPRGSHSGPDAAPVGQPCSNTLMNTITVSIGLVD